MGKHSAKSSSSVRNTAVVAAVGMGAAVLAPTAAQAAPAVHNATGFAFDIPDEFVPQVEPYLGQLDVSLTGDAPAAQGSLPQLPQAQSQNAQAAEQAKSKLGAPYVWGAAGPDSFDCSGLIQWAFNEVGKSVPRTSQAQVAAGVPVSMDDIQVGDVVGYYGGNTHIGIYVGNGQVIHAINSGTPVQITDINYLPVNTIVRL